MVCSARGASLILVLFALAVPVAACQPRTNGGPAPPAGPEPPAVGAESERAPDTEPAPRAEAKQRTPPPRTFEGVKELPVPGFGAALVILPYPEERAAILVAAHGAGDSPEWQCEHWNSVVRGRYLVLCPRGTSLGGGGYYFKNHLELEKELVAALAALRTAHGERLLDAPGVYTGYSQGATMGSLMIVNHGQQFPALLLVEGGSGEWTLARAKRFLASGGKSVGLVCGGSGCARRAEQSKKALEKAGLRARVEHVPGGGHTYVGPVGERAALVLDDWLVAE